jgi:hypothetical protein
VFKELIEREKKKEEKKEKERNERAIYLMFCYP